MDVSSPSKAIEYLEQMMDEMKLRQPVFGNKEEQLALLVSSVNPIRLKNNPISLDANSIYNLYSKIIDNE